MTWLRPTVFISYRRTDTSGYAGRLHDSLQRVYGRGRVFMDKASIEIGNLFSDDIGQGIEHCDVLLALIGPSWLSTTDEAGGRRLDDPADLVASEIGQALECGKRVIPALVNGARLPPANRLPKRLQKLVERQAIELSDDRWDYDIRRLTRSIGRSRHFLTALVAAVVVVCVAAFLTRTMTAPAIEPGSYSCTTGDISLPSCRVEWTSGDLRLAFGGPMHRDNVLIDRYQGVLRRLGGGQYVASIRNEFSADPPAGPVTTRTSELRLTAVGKGRASGTWAFSDGKEEPFEMVRKARP